MTGRAATNVGFFSVAAAAIIFCLLARMSFRTDFELGYARLTRLPCTTVGCDCCRCEGLRGGNGGGAPPRGRMARFMMLVRPIWLLPNAAIAASACEEFGKIF